ncbi:UDP-GalNAc:beta-1,3-N-acetylgalactosaminyltransferase 2-like [Antedon mediterranea]|uniref:UDP-GalNAc:beta-1, 3-N-acetylgalactosaminyltransferase 2-like n=1 Tax=Antedon mediterranea TaxID=105859 RepID=UPI003AF464ED
MVFKCVYISQFLCIPMLCIFIGIFFLSNVKVNEEKELVVGILSARENFVRRDVLRNTWVGYTNAKLQDRIKVKFVIGNKCCHIHEDDRISPYSCQNLHYDYKGNLRDEMFVFKDTISVKTIPIELQNVGFDFRVHHDVVIVMLGILNSCIQSNQNIYNVSVYDASHQEIFVSVNFSADDPGMLSGVWRFKTVKQMVYPKGFEGSLITRVDVQNVWQSIDPLQHLKGAVQEEDVITITKGLRIIKENGDSSFEPFMKESDHQLTNSNMLYILDDSEQVHSWHLNKSKRDLERLTELSKESKLLKEEQNKYNDIIFVDVIDVYSNIPSKLLKFYKWVSNSIQFKYIMKADDDTFVNPYTLIKFLDEYNLNASWSWWGSFRRNWKVNQYGKWADFEYNSLTYPPFACGSGNVLSSDLISWIANNECFLHCYQGEDISVGIWLAAVRPHYIHNSDFLCDNGCNSEMILSAQNSINDILAMWDNLLACKNPCRCF